MTKPKKTPVSDNSKRLQANSKKLVAELKKIQVSQAKINALVQIHEEILSKMNIGLPQKKKPKRESQIIKVELFDGKEHRTFSSFPITVGSRYDRDISFAETSQMAGREGYFILDKTGTQLNFISQTKPEKSLYDLDQNQLINLDDNDHLIIVSTIKRRLTLLPSSRPQLQTTSGHAHGLFAMPIYNNSAKVY